MRYFSFSLLISAGAVLGHFYIYRRLIRPLAPSRKVLMRTGLVLFFMTAWLLLRGPIRGIHPTIHQIYDVIAYGWIAFALSLVGATALGDGLRLALMVVRGCVAKIHGLWRRRGDVPVMGDPDAVLVPINTDRRRFARALPWAILTGGGTTAVYGTVRAFTPAEVTEVAVRLPRLPRTLDGLSIVQLTDVHVGTFIGRRFIERLVKQANALRPDVVAITGDLVDGDVPTLGHAVSALGDLRARFGSYFVIGNHEYYSGVDPWTRFLARIGVSVLRNRRVEIGDQGGRFDLVGVDDWSGGRRWGHQGYDLDAALRGRNPDHAAVLLAHQPKNFHQAVDRGIGLQISGHTHGGQVFPMTMLVGLGFEYSRGLYQHNDSHIYVSRGCGFWGPPTRVGSAPEIVKITLMA